MNSNEESHPIQIPLRPDGENNLSFCGDDSENKGIVEDVPLNSSFEGFLEEAKVDSKENIVF